MTKASFPTSLQKKSRFRLRCLRKWFKVGVFLFAWLFVVWIWICHPMVAVPINGWRAERLAAALLAANPEWNFKNVGIQIHYQRVPGWSTSLWGDLEKSLRCVWTSLFWERRVATAPAAVAEALPQIVITLNFRKANLTELPDLAVLRHLCLAKVSVNEIFNEASPSDLASLFDALKGMPLPKLWLTGTKVNDLTPLKGMRLKELSLGDTQVGDLSPLKGMPLKWLALCNTKVSDLTPLKGMPLKELDIRNTPAAKKPLPDWLIKSGCDVKVK